MDDLDHLIVAALKDNGRLSYSEIGRQLRQPASTVKRRVELMQSAGDITGFTVLTRADGPFKGTEAVIEIYCRGNVSTADLTALLSGLPGVTLAVSVAGVADAFAFVQAKDNDSLGEAIERLRASPRIERTRTSVVLDKLDGADPLSVRAGHVLKA
ncbi:Lrp/AsnC family transcriptional regulator [Herbiconiux liukaitaii]|uniref:Lrp/AsnC family transcriptional regulator n=1 Tax=Herbiconiux liukaitaii TaxID=3342799 RepID=UPI0035B9B7F0